MILYKLKSPSGKQEIRKREKDKLTS